MSKVEGSSLGDCGSAAAASVAVSLSPNTNNSAGRIRPATTPKFPLACVCLCANRHRVGASANGLSDRSAAWIEKDGKEKGKQCWTAGQDQGVPELDAPLIVMICFCKAAQLPFPALLQVLRPLIEVLQRRSRALNLLHAGCSGRSALVVGVRAHFAADRIDTQRVFGGFSSDGDGILGIWGRNGNF
jgi:hypothetical protein